MTKNPIYNALAATVYIVLVVFIMNYTSNNTSTEDYFLMPIMIISLFTLSAAIMAYIFMYQPVIMYLEGKKKEAINLFFKTIATFSIVPIGIAMLYILNILN